MARTQCLYCIEHTVEGWMIRCRSQSCGPYPTYPDALEEAVDEAEAAGRAGFSSTVAVLVGDRSFQIQWTYGKDLYPLQPYGRA